MPDRVLGAAEDDVAVRLVDDLRRGVDMEHGRVAPRVGIAQQDGAVIGEPAVLGDARAIGDDRATGVGHRGVAAERRLRPGHRAVVDHGARAGGQHLAGDGARRLVGQRAAALHGNLAARDGAGVGDAGRLGGVADGGLPVEGCGLAHSRDLGAIGEPRHDDGVAVVDGRRDAFAHDDPATVEDAAVVIGVERASQIGMDVDHAGLVVDGNAAVQCAESDELVRGAIADRVGIRIEVDRAAIDGRAAVERQHAEAGVLHADRACVGGAGVVADPGVSGTRNHAGATEVGRGSGANCA